MELGGEEAGSAGLGLGWDLPTAQPASRPCLACVAALHSSSDLRTVVKEDGSRSDRFSGPSGDTRMGLQGRLVMVVMGDPDFSRHPPPQAWPRWSAFATCVVTSWTFPFYLFFDGQIQAS